MLNLYKINANSGSNGLNLTHGESLSIFYHNFFGYPLTVSELVKWKASENIDFNNRLEIIQKSGYFYVEGSESLVYKRLLKKRISSKKIKIARKAATLLSWIKSIRLIAITGSLAMENSNLDSDIDLLIVTKSGRLWLTRLTTYLLLGIFGFQVRHTNNKNEKDKLCLNMWMDENDIAFTNKEKNLYTAHELAQITPLINIDKTYEKLLNKNRWILNFWPNAVRVADVEAYKIVSKKHMFSPLVILAEKFAYKIQYSYMRNKITRETITSTRAFFHPQDWSKFVLNHLSFN